MRRGYTLTELLVVIMIVVILVAAVLPIAKRVMDDSRTREASRLLGANFALAQAQAAKNNRPAGLWFELEQPIGAPASVYQCTKVYLAEVQSPYGGSTTSARGIIREEPNPPGSPQAQFVPLVAVNYIDNAMPFGQWDDDANGDGIPDAADQNPADGRVDEDPAEKNFLLSLIDDGDPAVTGDGELFQVRFDNKGYWFLCQREGSNLNLITVPASTLYPVSYNQAYSPGHSFQILRSPRRVGNPMELTAGTCIDLTYSGMGPTGAGPLPNDGFGAATNRLVVMFAPGGNIDSLRLDNLAPVLPQGTLHLLIGKTEKMNLPLGVNPDHPTNTFLFDPARSNLSDVNSVWVGIGRRNGSIASTENLPPPIDETTLSPASVTIFPGDPRQQVLNPTIQADREAYLSYCRELATGRDQMGGK